MFLLMVMIGIGFGLLAYRNGALLESGTTPVKNVVKATVDGVPVHSYVAENREDRRE